MVLIGWATASLLVPGVYRKREMHRSAPKLVVSQRQNNKRRGVLLAGLAVGLCWFRRCDGSGLGWAEREVGLSGGDLW